MAEPVSTEHEEAQKAIEALREAAVTLKAMGDEQVSLNGKLDEALDRVDELQHGEQSLHERIGELEELIADFRRGLMNADELEHRALVLPKM